MATPCSFRGSIYEACKFFELFDKTDLHGKCAIVTSYVPSPASIKGEESARAQTTARSSMPSTGRCWPTGSTKPPKQR